MTTPEQPQPPAETHRAAQAAIAIAAVEAIDEVWPSLYIGDLRGSLPTFRRLMAAIVRQYGQASAAAAIRYYRTARAAAGVPGPVLLKPAAPAARIQVGKSVDWAVEPLWSTEPDIELARKQLAGTAERLVLDTGRQTVVDNTQQDRRATGWARIAEPDACYFCALLATRGAVYKDGTFDASNSRFREKLGRAFEDHPEWPSEVKVHDHCRCHVEAVFGKYEPTGRVQGWQKLYEDSTAHEKNKLLAFRQAYEGRQSHG